MRYIATFKMGSYVLEAESDDIVKLKQGFYIDNQNRFTEETDLARYWIPPSAIFHIELKDE